MNKQLEQLSMGWNEIKNNKSLSNHIKSIIDTLYQLGYYDLANKYQSKLDSGLPHFKSETKNIILLSIFFNLSNLGLVSKK